MDRGCDEALLGSAVKAPARQRDGLHGAAPGVNVNGVGELYLAARARRQGAQGVEDVGRQEVAADAGAG